MRYKLAATPIIVPKNVKIGNVAWWTFVKFGDAIKRLSKNLPKNKNTKIVAII